MTFYVTNQNFVILCLFILGAVSGILYDIFLVKRAVMRTPTVLLVLEDIIYCLLVLGTFILTVFITNYGYIRWYELVSMFFGFLLYKIIFSYYFLKTALWIVRFIIRIIHYILLPAVRTIRLIAGFIKRVYGFVSNLIYDLRIKRYSRKRIRFYLGLSKNGFLD